VDPSQDPDRYDPARDTGEPAAPDAPALDPSHDPDRYRSPTLTGLLGDGAHEEPRDNLTWLIGLVSVLAFLGLVTLLVNLGTR
jgi:hypothetical protein